MGGLGLGMRVRGGGGLGVEAQRVPCWKKWWGGLAAAPATAAGRYLGT
jgi:hypothetical protein